MLTTQEKAAALKATLFNSDEWGVKTEDGTVHL